MIGRYIGKIVPSDVDGPGTRAVVHFAGCNLGCAGCFNPHTHDPNASGVWVGDAQSVARQILEISPRVTISGGEPTDQIQALRALLVALRARGAESVVMFTGRRIEWLQRRHGATMDEITGLVDVIIDGPYMAAKDETGQAMRGSSNQRILVYSSRYTEEDFAVREVQISVDSSGNMIVTGFPTGAFLQDLGA